MKIEKKIITELHHEELKKNNSLIINSCIIQNLKFDIYEPDFEIIIENSIISNLLIYQCWFKKGLVLKNNQIINYVDYQMGGHNESRILIEGNLFHDFVNFFDCQFEKELIIQNNIFAKGCNLFGNLNEGFKNTFNIEPIIKNNIGSMNDDGEGRN